MAKTLNNNDNISPLRLALKIAKKSQWQDVDALRNLQNWLTVTELDEVSNVFFMAITERAPCFILTSFIGQGADVNLLDKRWDDTPLIQMLHVADKEQSFDTARLQLLIDAGADINGMDGRGHSVLYWAIAYSRRLRPVVDYLIKQGADINQVDRQGATILMQAIALAAEHRWDRDRTENVAIIDRLLKEKPEIDVADAKGMTALLLAVDSLAPADIIKTLIAQGADVNHCNQAGETPLRLLLKKTHVWAQHGYAQNKVQSTFSLLLAAGANPNLPDKDGVTPLFAAVNSLRFGIPVSLLSELFDYGADIDAQDRNGETPLMHALRFWNPPFRGGWKPAEAQQITWLQALLENGADIECRNLAGDTPLMLLIKREASAEIIDFLIKKGADINAANHEGDTPLMLLIKNQASVETIDGLIKKGADIRSRNQQGKTAFLLEIEHGYGKAPLIFTRKPEAPAELSARLADQIISEPVKDKLTPALGRGPGKKG